MSDILERMAEVRARVAPRWTATRERNVRWQIERRIGWRRGAVRALAVLAAALVVLALGRVGYQSFVAEPSLARTAPAAKEERDLLGLRDGTRVTALLNGTELQPLQVTDNAVTVLLVVGSAHFDVAHLAGRTFRVQARDVVVTVLGTAFTVELLPDAVRVRVERGRVDVAWPAGHRQLAPGEEVLAKQAPTLGSAQFSGAPNQPALPTLPAAGDEAATAELPPEIASLPPEIANLPPAALPVPARGTVTQPSWRTLAQEGDYAGAFTKMKAEGSAAVRDEPGDLLFAADVARLSGHPALAVPRLEQVLRAHATDSRAPLAAFTLGRTLLDALGRPREAAEAFARARRLAPSGALSQDALAREVESWYRAGESSLAHDRAVEYLRRFPGGRREKAVRHQGGLELPTGQ